MLDVLERTVELLEREAIAAARVDAKAGVIRRVKIIGLASRNGYDYAEAALRGAIPKYEGAKVNVDHPGRHAPDADRSYRDRFGVLRNVQFDRDGLYGDLHYNPKHPLAEQVAWDAEHNPAGCGLSHNAVGRTARRGDKEVVVEIVTVRSVDLVTDPATTAGLFESRRDAMPRDGLEFTRYLREAEASGESFDHAATQAFRRLVVAAFDDPSLDTRGTLKRIGEILRQQERLLVGIAGLVEAPPDADEDADTDPFTGRPKPTPESTAAFRNRLHEQPGPYYILD